MNNLIICDESSHSRNILNLLDAHNIVYQKYVIGQNNQFEPVNFLYAQDEYLLFLALDVEKHFGILRERLYRYFKLNRFGFLDIDMRDVAGSILKKNGESRFIGTGVRLSFGVNIEPLVTLGDFCTIKSGSSVCKNSYVGENAEVGKNIIIGRSSFVGDDAKIISDVPARSRVHRSTKCAYSERCTSIWQFDDLNIEAFYFS